MNIFYAVNAMAVLYSVVITTVLLRDFTKHLANHNVKAVEKITNLHFDIMSKELIKLNSEIRKLKERL